MNKDSLRAKKAYEFIQKSDVCSQYKCFARGVVNALTGIGCDLVSEMGAYVRVCPGGNKDDKFLVGKVGRIVADPDSSSPGVEFTKKYSKKMHSCWGDGRDGYCWWIGAENLIRVRKPIRGKK
jgi:hypothetical protein